MRLSVEFAGKKATKIDGKGNLRSAGREEFLCTGGKPKGGDLIHHSLFTIPGQRRLPSKELGRVCVPCTIPGATALIELDKINGIELDWQLAALQEAQKLAGTNARVEEALANEHDKFVVTDGQRVPCVVPDGQRVPFQHQAQGMWAIGELGYRAMLTDKMGLGKSLTALLAWRQWWIEGGGGAPRKLVVVCPASVKYKWQRRELRPFLPEGEHVVLDGTPAKRERLVRSCLLLPSNSIVVNYDLLKDETLWPLLVQQVTDGFLIVDESHYVKTPAKQRRTKEGLKRNRSSYIEELSTLADGVLLLTGTPVRNMVNDLWQQLSIVNPHIWRNYWEFEDRYLSMGCITVGGKVKRRVVGAKNPEQLNAVAQCYTVCRQKEDCLDLPPKMPPSIIELEMDPESARIYAQMRDWWLYEYRDLDGNELIFEPRAKTALEMALRLEQIAQGFISGLPECLGFKQRALAHSAKLSWLLEFIDDLRTEGSAPVVWFKFNGPLHHVARFLVASSIKSSTLYGSLTSKGKDFAVQAFQGGESGVFLGQIKMAEGFDLTRSNHVIFFARDWSPAVNEQAEDRLHRIGQERPVSIHIPIMLGTIEEYIHKRLAAKAEDAASVTNTLTVGEIRKGLSG